MKQNPARRAHTWWLFGAVVSVGGCAVSTNGPADVAERAGDGGVTPSDQAVSEAEMNAADVEFANGVSIDEWADRMDSAWGEAEERDPRSAPERRARAQAGMEPFPSAGLSQLSGDQSANSAQPANLAQPGSPADELAATTNVTTQSVGSPHLDRAGLARELARLTAERAMGSATPMRDAVLLAAIEASVDGSGHWLGESTLAGLAPEEREAAELLRTMITEIGDGTDIAAAAERVSASLDDGDAFRVDRAHLCSRVEGFGRYEPFASDQFLAGRSVRAVVYAEVDGFKATPTTLPGGASGWRVELSQELLLYHDADGTLAWRQSPRQSNYTARTKPRDYFVVNQITLPSNLTIGSYHLKVVMRDAGGSATDETILPIQVVADLAVASGR